MKFSNKNYNIIAAYTLAVIGISILMVMAVFKFNIIWGVILKTLDVLMPVVWGLAIAYILNPVMVFTEKKLNRFLFRKKSHKKASRRISVAVTILLLLLLVSLLVSFVVPELSRSIKSIVDSAPDTIERIQAWINNFIENNEYISDFVAQRVDFNKNLDKLIADWQPMLQSFGSKTLDVLANIAHNIWDFVLGIIVSVYLLLSKETLFSQVKKVFFAFFSKKTCEKALTFYHSSNGKFIGFINGKIIDSLIIGMLCFVFLRIFQFQNNVILISVIIGITNIIPFFGPFIGAVPCGFLVLIAEPHKTLIFVIFILVLQQFDGNILGPRILGETTGLPAFWVLFAIFLGGGLFGFLGMVLSVPTFAVLYSIVKASVESRLEEKHLPRESAAYAGDVRPLYTVKRAKDMTQQELGFEEYLQKKPEASSDGVETSAKPSSEAAEAQKPEFLKPKRRNKGSTK